jgi:hypothetical protein
MAAGHSDGGSEEKTVSLRLTGHRQDARLVRIDAAHCECVSPCPRDSALCKHIVRGGQRVAGDERARCPRTFDTVGTRSNRRSTFHLSKALPRSPSADRPLWRSERIALSAAACGFFRRRRVKVFVNTAAHEEIALHQPLLAERLCVTDRQQDRARVSLELAAPQAAPGHRWESLRRRKYGQLAPPQGSCAVVYSKSAILGLILSPLFRNPVFHIQVIQGVLCSGCVRTMLLICPSAWLPCALLAACSARREAVLSVALLWVWVIAYCAVWRRASATPESSQVESKHHDIIPAIHGTHENRTPLLRSHCPLAASSPATNTNATRAEDAARAVFTNIYTQNQY